MHTIRTEQIAEYGVFLRQQERSPATIEKYTRALLRFFSWLPADKAVDKQRAMAYKLALAERYAPAGVNTTLAAMNGFLRFMGWGDCTVKPLRVQRRVFGSMERELSRVEYERLVKTAEALGRRRLSLLLQLMASTGIRVSEVRYVTVEAVRHGSVSIHLKGKVRVILLPGKLCRKLKKYIRAERIASGAVFVTGSGRPMDRKAIWAQMKRLCHAAKVPPEKVFPHNLRHLFARTFYQAQKDIAKLADLLGHSSVETTRIYLLSSGAEHRKAIERLRLIC